VLTTRHGKPLARLVPLTSLSSTGSGLVALGSGASMATLISTPRRLIRSGNSRVKTLPCSRFGGATASVSGRATE